MVERLMERGRGASEVTRDESEEEEEVERRRPRREGAARDNYREARSYVIPYVHGGADGGAPTGTRRGCTRRAARLGMELYHWLDACGKAARRRMGIG